MNCSELKNFINHYGIKAFCENFSNVCSSTCIGSNYNCECDCIDNSHSDDDNTQMTLYCDISDYNLFHTFMMYIINIFLIIAFVAFCCTCFAMCKRKFKKNNSYILNQGLPTYHQLQLQLPTSVQRQSESDLPKYDDEIEPPIYNRETEPIDPTEPTAPPKYNNNNNSSEV